MNIKVPVNLKLQPRRHTDTLMIHLMYLMIHFLCRKLKKIIVSEKFFQIWHLFIFYKTKNRKILNHHHSIGRTKRYDYNATRKQKDNNKKNKILVRTGRLRFFKGYRQPIIKFWLVPVPVRETVRYKKPIILSLFKIDALNFTMYILKILTCSLKAYVVGLHNVTSMNMFFTIEDHRFSL